jgi:molecular chaperone HtpG
MEFAMSVDGPVAEASAPEQFTFQTEIKQLLHLLSHSLYQHREIALRELISNASDALNKLRHVQLSDEQYRDESPLTIFLDIDKSDRVLTIRDNGIGLTRDELVENLGTIAHSGSLSFLNKLPAESKGDLSLIGQFGVGFYSAFMLADKVEVLTRSYRDEQGYRWESDGTGRFTITPVDNVPRGAQIRLHLKTGSLATEDAEDPGMAGSYDDYLEGWTLERVIGKYSTFVPFPIHVEGKQVNTQRPIWVEPKSQITEEQYKDFFGFLSHGGGEPRWHLHLSADSPFQFHAILYCPQTNLEKLGFGKVERGLHLCAKRILVQDDNRDLLPEYMRFLTGLVDSADLPLNVSRETLQDNTLVPKIRKILTRKVLDYLDDWSREAPEKYREFWDEFGSLIRTGVGSEYESRERLAKLLRYASTKSEAEAPTSLADYKSRMVEEQKQIYFACGPDAAALKHNPHLELYAKRGIEVLLITDPVDEWVLSQLRTFDETPIVAIDSAEAAPPKGSDVSESDDSKAADEPGFQKLLELFRDALKEKVSEVRVSTRLTDSPVCLVSAKGAFTPQLQMLLKATQKDFELAKRTFEVNPKSALIAKLAGLATRDDQQAFVRMCAAQLYSEALLLEGVAPEPHESVERMRSFMAELADKRG